MFMYKNYRLKIIQNQNVSILTLSTFMHLLCITQKNCYNIDSPTTHLLSYSPRGLPLLLVHFRSEIIQCIHFEFLFNKPYEKFFKNAVPSWGWAGKSSLNCIKIKINSFACPSRTLYFSRTQKLANMPKGLSTK